MDALRYARGVQSSEQAGAWPLAISLLLDRPRSFIHPSPAACRSQQVGGVAAASSSSSARDARHAIPRGCSLAARGPAAWRACPCISIRSAPYNPIHWGSVAHLASAPSPIQQPLQADPCVGHTRFSATPSPRPQAPCRAALLFRRRSGRGGGLVVVMAAPQSLNRRVGRELVTREPRVECAVGAVSCRRGLAAPRTLPRYRGPWLLASCSLYACVGRSRFVGTPPPHTVTTEKCCHVTSNATNRRQSAARDGRHVLRVCAVLRCRQDPSGSLCLPYSLAFPAGLRATSYHHLVLLLSLGLAR